MDPIGFAGQDVNLYRGESNNPTSDLDPWGLEDHHYVPEESWQPGKRSDMGFSKDAQKVFKKGTIDAPYHKGWSKAHAEYNKAVIEEMKSWLAKKQIDPSKMTAKEAEELLAFIKNSKNPAIRRFLEFIMRRPKVGPPAGRIVGRALNGLMLLDSMLWLLDEEGKLSPHPDARLIKREDQLDVTVDTWKLPDGSTIVIQRKGQKIISARQFPPDPLDRKH